MSEESVTPASTPQPQAQASELPPGPAPADGGVTEAAEGAAPEGQDVNQPTQENEEQRAKNRDRFDKRFSELTRRAREAEREAAYWRGRAEGRAQAVPTTQDVRENPAPQAPQGPPDPSKYAQGQYDPEYAADLATYRIEQKLAADREAEAKAKREREANEAFQRGAQRLQEVISKADAALASEQGQYFENAPEVLRFAARELPPAYVDLITDSANPVHVAELIGRGGLADDPVDLRALASMPLPQATRKIAKLDAAVTLRLAQARAQAERAAQRPATPAPQASPAPIPTAPAGGGAPVKDPSQMSMQEFAAWRAAGGGTR